MDSSASIRRKTIIEHQMYPILSEFLFAKFGLRSKRIDKRKSRNTHGSGGNKWLHPDVVAL